MSQHNITKNIGLKVLKPIKSESLQIINLKNELIKEIQLQENKLILLKDKLLGLQNISDKPNIHSEYHEQKQKILKCVDGVNGGKCKISDFIKTYTMDITTINIIKECNNYINNSLPIELHIDYGNNSKPRNNQSLGNQIPKKFKESKIMDHYIKFLKNPGFGYPDEKVKIKDLNYDFLWEWKSMNNSEGNGARIVISKFPNSRIKKSFINNKEYYHLWACIKYVKEDKNDIKKTKITIDKLEIYYIKPTAILNTKFELNTNTKQIQENIKNGHIEKL